MTILGIFPRKVKNIIFAWRGAREVRLKPCEVRVKQTSENSETQKNSNFFFGWRELWWVVVGAGGSDEGRGGLGQEGKAGGHMGAGTVRVRRARGQWRETMVRGLVAGVVEVG